MDPSPSIAQPDDDLPALPASAYSPNGADGDPVEDRPAIVGSPRGANDTPAMDETQIGRVAALAPAGIDMQRPSGNAVRVARHRARQEAKGLKQLNVQVPVDAHTVVKTLARRLRDGEDLTLVLFDLVATVTAPDLVPGNGAETREEERVERRQSPRPPLERTELKRAPPGIPTRPGEEEELIRRARQVLRRGGWRATVIRRMIE